MAGAIWTDIDSVKQHLGDAQNAKGYDDPDIVDQIGKAENFLRPYFVGAVGADTVKSWTNVNETPASVEALVSMLAAAKMLESYGGQSLIDEVTHAGSLWAQVNSTIKGIKDGSYVLVDAAGEPESGAVLTPFSSTLNKTPTFSMGNEGDGSKGSLDNF